MTPTAPGIISLSASQAEEFDPEQVGGCPRRWYYHRIARFPVPESDNAREDGDAGHALFATHYRGQPLPKRARMLKAVKGALAAGRLPAPEPGQLVESRFDGQPARDANGERLPLRHSSTLWLGGVPWDGYVDLRFYRAGTITVLDHKFSSDIHAYAKSDLLATVQMPVYALDSLRIWPEAQHVELVHHYVSRRGVDSFIRRQVVSVERIREQREQIADLAKRMQAAALAKSADDVPANKKSCHTWSGCPFQSRCSAFKEKPKMNLSDEELSWLEVVGGGEPVEKPNGPVGEPAPLPEFLREKLVTSGPDADRANDMEIASAARGLDPADPHGLTLAQAAVDPGDEDPFAVFAPVASVPQEQPAPPPGSEANPLVQNDKGIAVAKCPDCPHPAHPGATCTGRRGRGACKCVGVVANITQAYESTILRAAAESIAGAPLDAEAERERSAVQSGHLLTCVQSDAGRWLCMDGCTAGETAVSGGELAAAAYLRANPPSVTGGAAERHASEDLRAPPPGVAEMAALYARPGDVRLGTPSGWTGTLRVEVNLGPETLALLQRLLGGPSR